MFRRLRLPGMGRQEDMTMLTRTSPTGRPSGG